MDDTTTLTVEIGGEQVTLHRPEDYAVRMDIWELGSNSRMRARAAALGVCWRTGLKRPHVTLKAHGYNLAEYGGALINELMQRGVSKRDLIKAGEVAYRLVVASLVTEEDLAEARGNSSGEEGSVE